MGRASAAVRSAVQFSPSDATPNGSAWDDNVLTVSAVALRLFDINVIFSISGDESRVMSEFFSCFCNTRPVSQAFYRGFAMRRFAKLPFSVCF